MPATSCQRHGFGYVIRNKPWAIVRLHGSHGQLLGYPAHKGIAKVLIRVAYRSDRAVTQSVVVHWRRVLPKGRNVQPVDVVLDHPARRVQPSSRLT